MLFLRQYQLDIMLFMSGICGILAVLTAVPRSLSPKRRSILAVMEVASMFLLLFDRAAYLYRGNGSELGTFMVRFSNGMVYFIQLFIPHLVTRYLYDLFEDEGKLGYAPKRLRVCEVLFVIGTVLIIISQFTGLYYTFDAQNRYQRSPGFVICYIIPLLIILLQESVLFRYRNRLDHRLVSAIAASIALPSVMSFVQIFCYGVSLTNMTMVFVVIVFFVYALSDMNTAIERAKQREIDFYRKAEQKERAMFEQTAEALANAIDAKDKYTRGHSARVAMISRRLAEKAGFSKEFCGQVYYAALLHDVGKIGIHDRILNKEGKLSEEEFREIQKHPVYGNNILSGIRQSPYLCVGAHYHHERFDGNGYPDGIAGEDIPVIARIISVADAYDAMTSSRSYREAISEKRVKEELLKGKGTQFDPRFAELMLELMERRDPVCTGVVNSSDGESAEEVPKPY